MFAIYVKRFFCAEIQEINGASLAHPFVFNCVRIYSSIVCVFFFHLHSSESVDDKVQKCLESTIKIIRLIYDEVLSLERIRFAKHIESKYQPLEDLSDCVYFQRNVAEFNVDDIKVSQ